MKKLILLLTIFLPSIAMEYEEQPEKGKRPRTETMASDTLPPRKRIRTKAPLSAEQELMRKMSLAFLCGPSPQEGIASAEEQADRIELDKDSHEEKTMDILKRTRAYQIAKEAQKIVYGYKCPICTKTTQKSIQSIIYHILTHTGEKPFVCSICRKSVVQKSDLIKHMRIHTGERPFKCPHEGCDKCFDHKSCFIIHVRTHTGEKPFKCLHEGCEKCFAQKSNLAVHMRTHTKPFKCTHCEKAFSYKKGLQKHIDKKHSTEK